MLLRRRTGKTAALVIALGFGGGTIGLGLATALFGPTPGASFLPALTGYFLATIPFFVLAAIIAVCKSELWLIPEARVLRMLTFRPWRFSPRVEEAPVSEYAGVRVDPAPEDDGGGFLVSLVTTGGEAVPVRQFAAREEAEPFAGQLAKASGLWFRGGDSDQSGSSESSGSTDAPSETSASSASGAGGAGGENEKPPSPTPG